MNSIERRKGEKIHTRHMDISTYDGGDNHIIVDLAFFVLGVEV